MRVVTQFSVFLVNKPGVLAQVTTALAKAKANLVALTLVDSSEHGVLRIVCEQTDRARKILTRTHDRFTETEVISLELTNEPGAFADAAHKLAEAHININYAYCTGGARGGRTTAVFKVADLKKAQRVLKPASSPRREQRQKVRRPPKSGR